MLLPSSAANPANMIAQALTIYKSVVNGVSTDGSHVKISEARDTSHVGQAGFSLQDSKKKE